MKRFFCFYFILFLCDVCIAQTPNNNNHFKIGIYGATPCMIRYVNSCQIPYTTPLDNNNKKTSVLNVLVEDGFNIYQTYYPNEWRSEVFVKKYLELSAANNIEVLMNSGHYYKPTESNEGVNIYDNCGFAIDSCETPYSHNFFRAHIDNFMQHVFTQSPYKDIIWGYQISEEAASYHYHHNASDCSGNEWQNSSYFSYVEVPLTNVNQALNYYKNNLANNGIYDKKNNYFRGQSSQEH